MADIKRNLSDLQLLYADNTTAEISPNDLRDGFKSLYGNHFTTSANDNLTLTYDDIFVTVQSTSADISLQLPLANDSDGTGSTYKGKYYIINNNSPNNVTLTSGYSATLLPNNTVTLISTGIEWIEMITPFQSVATSSTPSINTSGDGSSSNPIYSAVKISADLDNAITLNPDGLFVSTSATTSAFLNKETSASQNVAGAVTWAETQSFADGIDITNSIGGAGPAIKMPNGTWIQPQTSGNPLYFVTGANPSPSVDNAILQLIDGSTALHLGDTVAGGPVAGLYMTKTGNDGNVNIVGYDAARTTYGVVAVNKEVAKLEYTKAGIVAAYLDLDTDATYENGLVKLVNRSAGNVDLNTLLMDTDTGVKLSNDQVANTDCFLQLQGTAAILKTSNSTFYEATNELNLGTVESALGTYDTTSPTSSFAEFRAFKTGYESRLEAKNGANYAYVRAQGSAGRVSLESTVDAQVTALATGSTTRYVTTDGTGVLGYSTGVVGSAIWGSITGTLSNQTDLQTALNDKLSLTATGTQSIASNLDVTSGWIQVSDTSGTPVSFLGITSAGKIVDGTTYADSNYAALKDWNEYDYETLDLDSVTKSYQAKFFTATSTNKPGDVTGTLIGGIYPSGYLAVLAGGDTIDRGIQLAFNSDGNNFSFRSRKNDIWREVVYQNIPRLLLGGATDDLTSALQVGGSVRTDSTITAAGYLQTSSYVLSINQLAGVDTGLTNMYGTSYTTGNRYTTLKTDASGSNLIAGVLGASGGVTNSLTVQAASNSNEESVFTFAVAGNTSIKKLAISDTTASTTSTTGALTVAGGAGIVGDLYGGGDGIFSGNVYANGGVVGSTSELQVNGSARISSTLLADNAVKTINTDANLLQGLVSYYGTVPETTGDRYLSVKATATGSQITAGVLGTSGGVTNSLTVQAASNSNEENVFTFAVAGNTSIKKFSITDTTDSTTAGTGSFTTLGGAGIAKDLSVGGKIRGVFPAASGTGIQKNISVDSNGILCQGAMLDRTWTLENPTSSEDKTCFQTRFAITMRELRVVLVGSSSPSVTFQIKFATSRSAAGTNLFSSSQTCTATSTGTTYSTFSTATIPAASWIWIETTATAGTVDEIAINFYYVQD